MSMNNVKFRKTVVPGDQLVLEVEMVSRRSKVIHIRAKALVNTSVVAEGEFTAAIVNREDGDSWAREPLLRTRRSHRTSRS